MKTFTILLFFIFLSSVLFGQESESTNADEKFEMLKVSASFKGGMGKFYQYVAKTLRYPAIAKDKGGQGKVFVEFVVDEEGKVVDESITIKESPHESLSEETIRIMKGCPDWIPGRKTKKGATAKQRVVLPITYRLR